MAAKGVAVKCFDGLDDVRPQGIQVYVADQSEEIVIFVAEYGFIAVLEQMSGALMTAVVVLGVPGELLAHDGGDAVLAALKKNMNVIIHQDPGVDGAFPLKHVLPEAFKEPRLVLIVVKYLGLINSPNHDMVQGTRNI